MDLLKLARFFCGSVYFHYNIILKKTAVTKNEYYCIALTEPFFSFLSTELSCINLKPVYYFHSKGN